MNIVENNAKYSTFDGLVKYITIDCNAKIENYHKIFAPCFYQGKELSTCGAEMEQELYFEKVISAVIFTCLQKKLNHVILVWYLRASKISEQLFKQNLFCFAAVYLQLLKVNGTKYRVISRTLPCL